MFLSSVREGPIYGCVCCHRIKFGKGVVEFSELLKEKINQQNPKLIDKAIGIEEGKFLVGNSFYICEDCKRKLSKGKMPALSHKNKLGMVDISLMKELHLTELENCLIARNILFQKFVQLPKSRWTATKDQIVNIPIFEQDIIKTVESFPRTPEEAGIIPVKLKRKLEYKNNHIEQYISTKKLFEALNTLNRLGNKYYQFVPEIESYKSKCQETDSDGFNLLFGSSDEARVFDENEIEASEVLSDSEKEEEEYILKDAARKWQFNYNSSTCFSNDFPKLDVHEDTNSENAENITEVHSVAPGEGKKPTNILNEEDWDVKSFPGLHPDASMGLSEQRDQRITDQTYFEQRILNFDKRFANTAAYVFAAFAYIEKKQLERNINISFMRGKPKTSKTGGTVYSLSI